MALKNIIFRNMLNSSKEFGGQTLMNMLIKVRYIFNRRRQNYYFLTSYAILMSSEMTKVVGRKRVEGGESVINGAYPV